MRIIFMGTPEFAALILEKMLLDRHKITAVYTKYGSVVYRMCVEMRIDVFTPRNLKDDVEICKLKELQPDLIIVAAYGLILRRNVLDIPKYGCLNVHPSDLPRWRGAAPIQRTLMAGDESTAVCIMKMDSGIDTGEVITREEFEIPRYYNAFLLMRELALIGARLLHGVLKKLEEYHMCYDMKDFPNRDFEKNDKEDKGQEESIAAILKSAPQIEDGVTYAHKIESEEEKIDWNKEAGVIVCQIKALSPKPGAFCIHKGNIIKIIDANFMSIKEITSNEAEEIFKSHQVDKETYTAAQSGQVVSKKMYIKCGENSILIPQIVQREGKKHVAIKDFLNGYDIKVGDLV